MADYTVTPTAAILAPYASAQISALGTAPAVAAPGLPGLAGLGGASTLVELSSTGQLLAATDAYRSSLANLRPGSFTSGLGQNFGPDFPSLAAEAQNFVDAFNTLQGNLARLQNAPGAGNTATLAAQFAQNLNAQTQAPLVTQAASADQPTSLADIGITLQPAVLGLGNTLSVDLEALQGAFLNDPNAPFALLAQAVDSFGSVASGFAATGQQAATLGTLAAFDLTNTSLWLPGLLDLLTVSSFNNGSATTLIQQLMALNEFNLVSTLT